MLSQICETATLPIDSQVSIFKFIHGSLDLNIDWVLTRFDLFPLDRLGIVSCQRSMKSWRALRAQVSTLDVHWSQPLRGPDSLMIIFSSFDCVHQASVCSNRSCSLMLTSSHLVVRRLESISHVRWDWTFCFDFSFLRNWLVLLSIIAVAYHLSDTASNADYQGNQSCDRCNQVCLCELWNHRI